MSDIPDQLNQEDGLIDLFGASNVFPSMTEKLTGIPTAQSVLEVSPNLSKGN